MTTSAYVPVSVTTESITQAKLQQMANNDQWLFENSPRVRYNYGGIVRDSGVKIIAGKVPYPISPSQYARADVMFGSFFSASCKPVVVAVAETSTAVNVREFVGLTNLEMNGEIDNRGFRAHITSHQLPGPPNVIVAPGWLHFIAMGF